MHQPPLPLTRDLVLIGGGHTHALVLRSWGMNPLPGVRVTLINPAPTAPYSGMLPGHLAGHYSRSALDIDLVQLARFAGARIIVGAAHALDPVERTVQVAGRPTISYDICSVDVGVTSAMPTLPGFAEHAVPAKPLGPLASRWAEYLPGAGPASVAVIGGGVAGAEIAMAMAHALRQANRTVGVTLIEQDHILSAVKPRTALSLRTALADLGVKVIEQAVVGQIDANGVLLRDGRRIDAGFVTGAAGAQPYDWIAQTGVNLHQGFIAVNAQLQSSDAHIFAVGDCAHLTASPRPKAGVFAVREAPVLFHNLRAALSGGAMRAYRPQRDYLKLISMGGKSALAERFGLPLSGSIMWQWKNHIDQKFMHKFSDLPRMPTPRLPSPRALDVDVAVGPRPMCGGCGAKVGRGALTDALARLDPPRRSDIRALPGDDAALLLTSGAQQVISTDHLRSFTNDPVVMTRIAAVHALGDIWAMGARPQAALVSLILPRLSDSLTRRTIEEIMQTAQTVLRDAGAEIVGGHSSVGDEMTIGFSITGLCDDAPITLRGAQPGDALILTKPLGSGVILAAEMTREARGDWVIAALDLMQRGQGSASKLMRGAHAMTDVTGFGLAGHLRGICDASGVGAEIVLHDVPLMPGAFELSDAGIRSTIFAQNRAVLADFPSDPRRDLLFDPQTAGGLLAAVAADKAPDLIRQLQAVGDPAAIIGHVTAAAGQITIV
ncbi:selenide, water dikinase SelD [Puniceibacterium sp. IMCC21224]|uniref:selenide, water dikinase SelD n=1 Tax=Puniceibacterium sp. IMCC21224 TaxID=1618204 RepID=UPI00064DD357|nr:selenide, water dikinase SelD [Puniceibacterium sp. IMCC21224]KMK68394.1 selenophosphate synthase [Puniceibacterium sp. IMCC21224]